jgi:hypothetical protein
MGSTQASCPRGIGAGAFVGWVFRVFLPRGTHRKRRTNVQLVATQPLPRPADLEVRRGDAILGIKIICSDHTTIVGISEKVNEGIAYDSDFWASRGKHSRKCEDFDDKNLVGPPKARPGINFLSRELRREDVNLSVRSNRRRSAIARSAIFCLL